MNKKILLIIPDVFDVSDKYKVSILGKYGTYLPLGPLYLAAIIENQGLEVKFIDNTLYEYPNDKLIEIILANSPDYLGFSTSFLNIYNAKEIARKVKQKNKKILTIFGGPQATHTAEELIKKPYVDYIIVGEGEKTIEELVSGKPPEKIAGLYSKQNNNPSYPGHRPPIEDLDSLPYPALHLADIAGYRQKSPNVIQLGALSSRGCPYHCTFCGLPPWLKKYRLRNPKKVVDEIEFITKKYNDNRISFKDDEFLISKSHVSQICDEILIRGLKVVWDCKARVDHIDEALLEKMQAAGCSLIFFGVESGSPRILKQLKKGTNLAQIKKAFVACKKVGIKTFASFMFGVPGETKEDIVQSFDLMRKLAPDQFSFQPFVAMPGTPLHTEVLKTKQYCAKWENVLIISTPKLPKKEIELLTREIQVRSDLYLIFRKFNLSMPEKDLLLYHKETAFMQGIKTLKIYQENLNKKNSTQIDPKTLKKSILKLKKSPLQKKKPMSCLLLVYLRYLSSLFYLLNNNKKEAQREWEILKKINPVFAKNFLGKYFVR